MRRTLLLAGVAVALSGCGVPAAIWAPLAGSGLSYVASLNNVGVSWLKWTHDDEVVCPVALRPRETCPVEKVKPSP